METTSNQKSWEEVNLYKEIEELNRQLHSAQAQLKSANAQHHQWLQEKEKIIKENNELKQKVKELTDQLGKNVGQRLTQIETLKKEIETYQRQLEEEKQAHDHDVNNFWKAMHNVLIDGRILKTIKNIIHEDKYTKLKNNQWLNSDEMIELIDKINNALYNNGIPFKYLIEEKIPKEMQQKLKEVEKSEKK